MVRVIGIHYQDGRHKPGPPVRDDRLTPVIAWALANGGFDQPWLVPIRWTENRDQADDVRRSLYNAARYFCSCGARNCARKFPNYPHEASAEGGCPDGGKRVSAQAVLVMHRGHVRVQFTFFDKREAIRHHIAAHGPDPSQWPYFARARRQKGRAANGNV